MKRLGWWLPLALSLLSSTAMAASYRGLNPGVSNRQQIEQVLGPPIAGLTPTLVEYNGSGAARRIYVDYDPSTQVAERISVHLNAPVTQEGVLRALGSPGAQPVAREQIGTSLVEYLGPPNAIALTYQTQQPASGVESISYLAPDVLQGTIARLMRPPAPPQGPQPAMEASTDRPGGDYVNYELTEPDADLCRQACAGDGRCKAFTYVAPGIQGPRARCWLKSTVPAKVPNACCTSGTRD